MLFLSIVFMTVGYTMLYSALHGHWEFWKYFYPTRSASATPAAPAQPAAAG